MTMDSSEILKYLPYILSPLGALLVWLYKQHDSFVDDLNKRICIVEQTRMVNTLMLENMKEDISEIKTSVAKLIERRTVARKG